MALSRFGILALAFVALLGGVGVALWQNSSDSSTQVLLDYGLEPLPCDLNKRPCQVKAAKQTITFDLTPRPLEVMGDTLVRIEGLDSELFSSNPSIRIFGLNMDMGKIITSLTQTAPGRYEAKVALSACLVENIMRYRIALYDGNTPLDIFVDFDLWR